MAEIEIDDRDVSEVWEALVDNDRLARWLGSESELDPTPGGRVYTTDAVTGEPKRGRVTEVEPDERLVLDWWPVAEPERVSEVAIELTPTRRGTLVTVTETPTWLAARGGGAGAGGVRASAVGFRSASAPGPMAGSGGPGRSGAVGWSRRLERLGREGWLAPSHLERVGPADLVVPAGGGRVWAGTGLVAWGGTRVDVR